MDEVKVLVAHSERATLRVGDVFLKVDADQARIDVEVEAMALAPVPTPEVLWRVVVPGQAGAEAAREECEQEDPAADPAGATRFGLPRHAYVRAGGAAGDV